MALLTKGLRKKGGSKIRSPLGTTPGIKRSPGGGQISAKPPIKKAKPPVKRVGTATGGGYTPGSGKVGGLTKAKPGVGGTKPRPVKGKPIPGRKPAPGSRVKPGGPAVKPNRGAQIAAKKKVFAAKRANKLANQKKLAARKRGLAKKRQRKMV